MKQNLIKFINRFPKANVLIIGDIILDEYIWGDAERISPEAPVPVVWAKRRSYLPGGAANVAANVRSLGGKVKLIGIVGDDQNAHTFLSGLKKQGIDPQDIIVEKGRRTTLKTRIIAGHQQVVRIDWEDRHAISEQLNSRIIGFVQKNIQKLDAIIIEDYGKGLINPVLLSEIIAYARQKNKIITVDPKEEHFVYYRGVTAITPNRKETENAIRNLKIKDTQNSFRLNFDRLLTQAQIDLAAKEILRYLELESLLVTLGEEGMRLFEKGAKPVHIPTVAQEVFDVSGAGDTVIAAFTLGLCAGASKLEASQIANFAAGVVVAKVGVVAVSAEELKERIRRG